MTLNRVTKFAIAYRRRGWPVIPIPYKRKGPTIANWRGLRLSEGDLLLRFNGEPTNIGVLLGEPSGIIDIDLDCLESRKLAEHLLPPTDMRFGRNGSPNSHWVYKCVVNGERTSMFKGPAGDSLLELRATGSQTLFPPSIHPNGDEIGFESKDDPAHVDLPKLREAVHELAAACLLLRHYPVQGSRHDYCLAIAGGLLRASWPVERVRRFLEAIVTEAGDGELDDRLAAAGTTHRAIMDGREVSGWPSVSRIIDGSEPKQQFVARIRRHLGIDRKPSPSALAVSPQPAARRTIAREAETTEPYANHMESLRAVDHMADVARHLRQTQTDLAVEVSIWLDRRGVETLDVEYPIAYVSAAIGVSRGHFHKLGQIGRVRRCRALCDTSLALSDRAILPLARLLDTKPEALPQAVEAAQELAKAEAVRKERAKPKPVNYKQTTAAVDSIIGPVPKHIPVRRKPSANADAIAADGLRRQISNLVDAAAMIDIPPDLMTIIRALGRHSWSRK